jgi:hypothetical protein
MNRAFHRPLKAARSARIAQRLCFQWAAAIRPSLIQRHLPRPSAGLMAFLLKNQVKELAPATA